MDTEKKTAEDWVEETYQAFIAHAVDVEPTNPVKALEAYFEKTASEELKTRCAAEGKTAAKCWTFVERVARKALKGGSGHVDPSVVYAIAMHWFQDVPADWDAPAPVKPKEPTKEEREAAERAAREQAEKEAQERAAREQAEKEAQERAAREAKENPLGLDDARVEAAEAPSGANDRNRTTKIKPKHGGRKAQGFFFDVLEQQEGGEK